MKAFKFIFFFLTVLIIGCQSGKEAPYEVPAPQEFNEQMPGQIPEQFQEKLPDKQERKYERQQRGKGPDTDQPHRNKQEFSRKRPKKIIYMARIRVLSYNPEEYYKKIIKELEKYQGYIQQEESFDNNSGYHLVLKVLPEHLFPFLEFVKKNADHLSSYNISAQDITRQYYDIQRRIQVKKELEKQYLEILKKARRIPDILETQRYINSVRQEIESLEGQLRYYSHQTDYATVHLNISKYTVTSKPFGELSFGMKIAKSFKYGMEIAEDLFLFLITIWPFYFLFAGIYFLVRHLRRRKKRKEQITKQEEA